MKVAEVLVREVFKILVAVKVDRVPELRLTMVQVIDGVQVHVFLVPAEKRSPDTYIQVGLRDARDVVC